MILDIVSSADGSAMVNYGESVVVAALKTEVAEPEISKSDSGFLGI
jgi:exosome complex RNA-binding protein Rrp42 (RNase PH superfamily)